MQQASWMMPILPLATTLWLSKRPDYCQRHFQKLEYLLALLWAIEIAQKVRERSPSCRFSGLLEIGRNTEATKMELIKFVQGEEPTLGF